MYSMQGKERKTVLRLFFLFVVLVVAERFVRAICSEKVLQINPNVVFGQMNFPYPFVAVVGTVLILFVLWRYGGQVSGYTGVVLLTGTLLNLYDWWRIMGVMDYFRIGSLVFNVSDLYVIIGLILLVSNLIFSGKSKIDS